ncbi:hypothetical protein K0M31_002584 [Melipona bicolor]|uniref:Hcy-binding domain-containing protein n=1 Tax=Melipona bicolor TaxID=60889 RepID=A0AA40GHV1_9HYME|nr:hypothetical protein K0M31_002584 [Melipona bicolor]
MDIKILDGGFATQLSTHVGAQILNDPLWVAKFIESNPRAIYDTHLDFLKAGADIIETSTYQVSISDLVKYLSISETEAKTLLRKSVDLAKDAVKTYTKEVKDNYLVENKHPIIAGSCGPYGASLHDGSEYNGVYGKTTSRDIIMDWHKSRINGLIDAGINLLALETIPCYEEAEALIELLKEYPHVKAWLSFSCEAGTQNIVDGSNFQEVVLSCYRKALPGQIIAVGVNCIAPKDVTPLLKNINTGSANEFIPLIAYPNSGEIYSAEKVRWMRDKNHGSFESFISEWLELGIQYIGGCCRMYAENIKSIRKEVYNCKKNKATKVD